MCFGFLDSPLVYHGSDAIATPKRNCELPLSENTLVLNHKLYVSGFVSYNGQPVIDGQNKNPERPDTLPGVFVVGGLVAVLDESRCFRHLDLEAVASVSVHIGDCRLLLRRCVGFEHLA